jgi:ribonuclease PH
MRKDNRDNLSLRKIEIIPNFIKNSEGSCLVRFWRNAGRLYSLS